MNEMLVELLRHDTWATLRLLDSCAPLTAEELRWSAPGTYGAVGDALTHLCAAEQRYAHARWSGDRLAAIAAETGLEATLDYEYEGKPCKMRKLLILLQAIDRGREHRTHATTVLSQHSVTPPLLDGWTYGEMTRLYWESS